MKECIEYMDSFEMEIKALEGLVEKTDDNKIQILLQQEINSKKSLLSKYRSVLNNISSNDICCRLFAKMMGGTSATKAVNEVARENYFSNTKPSSLSTIWRYYAKIKELL